MSSNVFSHGHSRQIHIYPQRLQIRVQLPYNSLTNFNIDSYGAKILFRKIEIYDIHALSSHKHVCLSRNVAFVGINDNGAAPCARAPSSQKGFMTLLCNTRAVNKLQNVNF